MHVYIRPMCRWVLSSSLVACSAATDESPANPPATIDLDSGAGPADGGGTEPEPDASTTPWRADRFVTTVVRFTPGECAGFGATSMPQVVYGPPRGAGDRKGSLDVVTLGIGGEIIVGFAPNRIIDGPGPDFIVFENAFFAGGDPTKPSADPGEISVSEDGETWHAFPCPERAAAPFSKCAGAIPVRSSPANGISPFDVANAGGEAYDLSELGVQSARFVRIRDRSSLTCTATPKAENLGFDLDAIAIVNAEIP